AAIERLHHPNVVRGLGHGTLTDGRPYLILEYLDGPSLREVIRDRGAISPDEALEILGPLCSALEVAHAAGLVHRDLKASNVVLARDASGGKRPVLLDFGLVKLLDQLGPGLTSSRTMLGTPTAMAPEQMRGEAVDARTDVYSLGLLAYHMLTGQPAFTAGGGAIKSYLQLHGPRPRPSAKIDIDPAIDRPVMRALAPAPDDRYPTVGEFFSSFRTTILTTSTQPVPRESDPAIAIAVPLDVTISSPTQDVVAFYMEADKASVAQARAIVTKAGMTLAISAPDSLLAVAPKEHCNILQLKLELEPLSAFGRIAIGHSRASIRDTQVDGPALDAESWAPYPLSLGLWVSPDL
ncbi:MAG: serine/threonine protein kinase, partial [Deltaproteobacteria bacterium]|nr:serine/threonine protein kinase [Deltaproteobacteria bacterium]